MFKLTLWSRNTLIVKLYQYNVLEANQIEADVVKYFRLEYQLIIIWNGLFMLNI